MFSKFIATLLLINEIMNQMQNLLDFTSKLIRFYVNIKSYLFEMLDKH